MKKVSGELAALIESGGAKADLHTHSRASDGSMAPDELAGYAKSRNVLLLALTDHDTLAGLDGAAEACRREGVSFAAGIELSALWRGREIHVVGLCADRDSPVLREAARAQLARRKARAEAIGARLEKAGFAGAYLRTLELAGGEAALTRGSFVRFLLAAGARDTAQRCFRDFLAEGRPGYVKPDWMPLGEAAAAIRAAGGIAVLAHPGSYKLSGGRLRALLDDFAAAGGEALEAVCSIQSPSERAFLAELARGRGLYVSCGSDFHEPGGYLEVGRNIRPPAGVRPVWTHPGFTLEV